MKPKKILYVLGYAVLLPAGALAVLSGVGFVLHLASEILGIKYGIPAALIALMAIAGGIGGAAQYDAKHGETDDQHTD